MNFDENFWLAICFIIFIYFTYKPVRKSIIKALDARIASIKSQILAAELVRKEAEALLARTEKEIDHLSHLRDKILAQTKTEIDYIVSKRTKEVDLYLERAEQDALNIIKTKQSLAKQELREYMLEQVAELVTRHFQDPEVKNKDLDYQVAKNLMHN